MTGFGSAEGAVGGARVAVEIRSVNHRFFNPSIKLPSALSRWESEVREALRRTIGRGHVTLTARVDRGSSAAGAVIDEDRFAAYVQRLSALQLRHGLSESLGIDTILRLPDVIASERDDDSGTAVELVDIVNRAAASLSASREAEGARLAQYLSERVALIEAATARLAARAPHRLVEQRDRLRTAVSELAVGIQVDEQRLAQEVAFL
ncbi:MAG: YicC/YloC family endoribonuclease, partial [Gemmatimonadaceae bacterium]